MNTHLACNAKCRCGRRFHAERSTARFCSTKCRVAAHRKAKRDLDKHDWYSPTEVVEAARRVFGGIDLDPASCAEANAVVKAARYYTRKDDGLKQPWRGRVWMNPSFGRFAPLFAAKLATHYLEGAVPAAVAILAAPSITTRWADALMSLNPVLCTPPERFVFRSLHQMVTQTPARGTVVLGLGVDREAFTSEFGQLGRIWSLGSTQRAA
jgi:ParB family chromosome partitioning protein